jgi:hypothetical protein
MDRINAFIQDHHYSAGQLNRKMLENNGTENYTSAKDCGRVLRKVYKGSYVSKEASERILEAMRAQIARNRYKIPAGVPESVETANKTGELYTKNKEGINVSVQNDAAIIFAEDHPYVLTVMTAVPGAGEDETADGVSVHPVQNLVQVLQNLPVQRVQGLGPIQGQGQDAALLMGSHKGHICLLSPVPR